MTTDHMTQDHNEAKHTAGTQTEEGRPRVRRVAVIRTGRTGFTLVAPVGELIPGQQ